MNWEDAPELLDRLHEVWPGYNPRPGQRQMSRAVAHAIATGLNLLVEGGTGVGKSVAYLLPAALAALEDDSRVVIATSHKHLQDQLSGQDLPRIEKLMQSLGFPNLPWATLKGLANYVCLVAVQDEYNSAQPHPLMPQLIEWLRGNDHNGEFDQAPFPIPNDLRMRLSTEPEECPHNRCPLYDPCLAMAAKKRAANVPIVVTNHALLALDVASGGHMLPGPFGVAIVDEAHAFEEATTRAFGFECSSFALHRILDSEPLYRNARFETLSDAQDALSKLDADIAKLLSRRGHRDTSERDDAEYSGNHLDLEAQPEGPPSAQPRALLKGALHSGAYLADLLDRISRELDPENPTAGDYNYEESPFDLPQSELDKLSERDAALKRAAKRCVVLADRLRTVCAVNDPLLVYFVEQLGSGPGYSLQALPVEIGAFLEPWWEEQATILTSATLSDGRTFEFFSGRLGVPRSRTLIVPSPFDYPARTRLVLTPVPGQESAGAEYFERLAYQLAKLMDAAGGKCLLLFTSHRAMDEVYSRLSIMRMGGWSLYKQGSESQATLMANLRAAAEDERVAMFATRSWWQGVDLPGMRLVAMDKLPFPQLGDPLVAARNSHIEATEGESFRNYMLPQALIAFRQGFGRLMRSEKDYGAVAVCDERLLNRQYGNRFLAALPGEIPILYSADELRSWIRSFDAPPKRKSRKKAE